MRRVDEAGPPSGVLDRGVFLFSRRREIFSTEVEVAKLRRAPAPVCTATNMDLMQARLRASRDWRFPMVSHAGSRFAQDMGYRSELGGFLPGLSVFQLDAGRIARVSASGSDVRDDFCSLWHLFDLLPEGAAGWRPRFQYNQEATSERRPQPCANQR